MKKIISVIMALLVLAVCLCPATVLAAGKPTFEVSSAKAARNEGAEITVSIKNNPGITSAKLLINFDSALTLKTVEFGDQFKSNAMASKELTSPATLNWASGLTEIKGDAVFATLTFAAGSKAEAKDYKISVSYDEEDVFNLKEKNVKFETVDGKFTVTGAAAPVITGEDAATATDSVNAPDSAADGAASSAEQEVTGAYNGDGEYTGPELTFDEDGNVVENDTATAGGISIWLGIAAAILIIAAAIFAFITLKKKKESNSEQ